MSVNATAIDSIRAEWSTDAFVIEPRLLLQKCKEWCHQNVRTAQRLGQPHDITPERLYSLYKRQRGRCALSGVPMTYGRGIRTATQINLDHIADIKRGSSLDSVAAGGSWLGGHAAMLQNLRFLCEGVHHFRNKLESLGDELGDIRYRIAVWCELGSPVNSQVDVYSGAADFVTKLDIENAILGMSQNGRTRLSARQIMARLTSCGLPFDPKHVADYMMNLYGCDAKSLLQRSRVVVATQLLASRPDFIEAIKTSRGWFSVIDGQYCEALRAADCDDIKHEARREDLVIAYEVVTGRPAPFVEKTVRSQHLKQKLSHWSRVSPVTRKIVHGIVKSSGRRGVHVDQVIASAMEQDAIACLNEASSYRDKLADCIRQSIQDIEMRGWIDVDACICRARLAVDEAAAYCGHTAHTFRKYHKVGIGPKPGYSRFGHSRSLSFSYCDLDSWLTDRKEIRMWRVDRAVDADAMPLFSGCANGQ